MRILLVSLAGAILLAACSSSSNSRPAPAESRKDPPPAPAYQSRERSTAPSPVFRLENAMTEEQAEAAGVDVPEDEEKPGAGDGKDE